MKNLTDLYTNVKPVEGEKTGSEELPAGECPNCHKLMIAEDADAVGVCYACYEKACGQYMETPS